MQFFVMLLCSSTALQQAELLTFCALHCSCLASLAAQICVDFDDDDDQLTKWNDYDKNPKQK